MVNSITCFFHFTLYISLFLCPSAVKRNIAREVQKPSPTNHSAQRPTVESSFRQAQRDRDIQSILAQITAF